MKKASAAKKVPEMRAEYDFSKGKRGKYAKAHAQGTNIIVLDPGVAAMFPGSKAVNEALKTLLSLSLLRVLRALRGESPCP